MNEDLIYDPYRDQYGLSLTAPQITIICLGGVALVTAQLDLEPPLDQAVGAWRRVVLLLVGALIMYHFFGQWVKGWNAKLDDIPVEERKEFELLREKRKLADKANLWASHAPAANEASHPSAFLTTRDAKPRLFPFPLGSAGGPSGLKSEMWWEAGNSAHVGHYNQADLPEEKARIKVEMEHREEKRYKEHKEEVDNYRKNKKKWAKRLSHVKFIAAIVALGLFHRGAAAVCLAALIWFILATELAGVFSPKIDDEVEPNFKEKKKASNAPGMGMTYIYEPKGKNEVKPTGAFPVQAPANRLITSVDTRYAS